jgi:hypothetical protein
MITGQAKTEKSYRAIQMDSSSSLKEFSMDRKKYHKKYILNETVEEKENQAANMGRIVETLLMEPEEFDARFYMSSCASVPTGLMLAFVEALYVQMKAATDEYGALTREFSDMAKDAYTESGFKIKLDAVLGKFQGSDAEIYFNEILLVRTKGLTVVSTQDVVNGEKIVAELKSNFVTAEIVNLVNSSKWTINNQLQIEGYSVEGHLFKSMFDKLIINHENKTIQVYDLKCTWSVENFYEEYYLYRRAYIQAYLYYMACKSLTLKEGSELSGYTVEYPKFIVCDSTNYFNPLVYTMTLADILDAADGFEHKGRTYPGVIEIIENLKWAQANDVWNISKENYINNGQVNIKG